jgi:hypothetical protein
VSGSFVFAVGERAAPSLAGAARPEGAWSIAVALNRCIHYASVLLALGSVVFRQGAAGAAIAALACLLALGFGGAEMLAGGAGAFLSAPAWTLAAKSTLLPSALLGVPGALLLVALLRTHRRGRLLWLGSGLVLASFLVTGHAATGAPVGLMAPSVAVHLVCAALWFAALVPLLAAGAVGNCGAVPEWPRPLLCAGARPGSIAAFGLRTAAPREGDAVRAAARARRRQQVGPHLRRRSQGSGWNAASAPLHQDRIPAHARHGRGRGLAHDGAAPAICHHRQRGRALTQRPARTADFVRASNRTRTPSRSR